MANPKPTTTPKSDQQLGTLIAAVLNHPDTPEGVYNSIGDALAELQSQPGHSMRPETIQAALDAAKGPAAIKKDEHPEVDHDPDLKVTDCQFLQLRQVWYAIGELAEMIDPPKSAGGGMECLKIVGDQLGNIVQALQEQRETLQEGGAE
jgi:hypothetical protein